MRGLRDRSAGFLLRGVACAVATVGCGGTPSVPMQPTWADVEPIVRCSCTQCHGATSAVAGSSYRFDFFDMTPETCGEAAAALGDQTMARGLADLMAMDVVSPGSGWRPRMPPAPGNALPEWQQLTIQRWAMHPMLGLPPPGNHRPEILVSSNSAVGDKSLSLSVVLSDADHESVVGVLRIGEKTLLMDRSGAFTGTVDTSTWPDGIYPVVAVLCDGWDNVTYPLGNARVAHAESTKPPALPAPDAGAPDASPSPPPDAGVPDAASDAKTPADAAADAPPAGFCGDRIVQSADGEQCDPQGPIAGSTNTCSALCKIVVAAGTGGLIGTGGLTASGGTMGGGGSNGGSAGGSSGGGGSAGGMTGGGVTVTPGCRACEAAQCAPQGYGCNLLTGSAQTLCNAVEACIRSHKCDPDGDTSFCYCGAANQDDGSCLSMPLGPCVAVMEAADTNILSSDTALQRANKIFADLVDPSLPLGKATDLLGCDAFSCNALNECFGQY